MRRRGAWISRKTGYFWLDRYFVEGLEGLQDRSRRNAPPGKYRETGSPRGVRGPHVYGLALKSVVSKVLERCVSRAGLST